MKNETTMTKITKEMIDESRRAFDAKREAAKVVTTPAMPYKHQIAIMVSGAFIIGGALLAAINISKDSVTPTPASVAVEAPAPVVKSEAPAPVVKPEVEPVESEYDRMPQECKDAGATPDECAQAAELLERVNEGPTWSGAEFDYNRSLVK